MNTSSKKWAYIILLVALLGGAIAAWMLFSSSSEQGGGSGLFPFFGQGQQPNTDQQGNTDQQVSGEDIFSGGQGRQPILYKLHNVPVASLTTYTHNDTPYVRYIERGLGHVYETSMSTLEENQVSIETIPGVQDAVWSSDASYVATRRSGDGDTATIETYALKLPAAGDTSSTETSGVFLPQNIVGFSSQGNNLFYLVKTSSGVVGNISSFEGTNRRQIFSSPFTEWLVSWPSTNTLLLSTKPSGGVTGHVYTLSASSGSLSRKIANVPGITDIANKDVSKILYLASESGYTMHLFDVASSQDVPFNFFTMPEKCTWSNVEASVIYCAIPNSVPSGKYPDDWYQGVVSFSDSLWRINTDTGDSTRIVGLSDQEGDPMDAINLSLDADDLTISFINKRNGLPWRVLLDQTAFGNPAQVSNDPTQPEN